MSSTEIAKLTGKQKSNIHRDIKDQLLIGLYGLKDDSNLNHVKIQGITIILDNRGYWKEVLLDREHTLTLVTGYDVKARHAINKRWLKLEAEHLTPNQREPLLNVINRLSSISEELVDLTIVVMKGDYIAKDNQLDHEKPAPLPSFYLTPAERKNLDLENTIAEIYKGLRLAENFRIAIRLHLLRTVGTSPDYYTPSHLPTIDWELNCVIREIVQDVKNGNCTEVAAIRLLSFGRE
jgi:hypothetical protein